MTDMLAGRLTYTFDAPSVLAPHIQSGGVRAHAIANICALNRHVPAPLDERRLIALFPPAMVDRRTDQTVRLYEGLFEEVKHMVETGQSVAPDQRYRIVYFGIAHTYGHPEMARILRDAGAEIVASVYTFGTTGNFKGLVNGKWTWEPIDPAWVDELDLSTRRDACVSAC